MLGQALLRNGDRTKAIQCWRKVIEMNPDHGEALYNLSRLLSQSEPAEAKVLQDRFEALQARRHIMDRAQTLGNFALSSSAAHDWPQAIAQLQEGLKICGDCSALALLHKNLGLIYCRSGDLKNGRLELLEARKLTPKDPDITAALQLLEKLSK
jgi:tetratricopeptide (TPR) repeat protein